MQGSIKNVTSPDVRGVPVARVTVQGELEALFNALVTTGAEVAAMEEALEPIAHAYGVGEGVAGDAAPPQPSVISSIRGMIASVETFNARLSVLRNRLAL